MKSSILTTLPFLVLRVTAAPANAASVNMADGKINLRLDISMDAATLLANANLLAAEGAAAPEHIAAVPAEAPPAEAPPAEAPPAEAPPAEAIPVPAEAVPPPAVAPAEAVAAQPFIFARTMAINAVPEQVVNGTTPTGGLAGSTGTFSFGLDAASDTICYNITLNNFQGEFSSPAVTATHIHEAALGASGPPRIAFPNPAPVAGDPLATVRNSVGCMRGPFTTGVMVDGVDSGTGFTIAQIEANPAGFFADTHSSLALPGAVRGQLA